MDEETANAPGAAEIDDEALYDLIWDAEREGLLEIGIDLRKLNRPGSPAFSMWDNAIPGMLFVVVVLATLIFAGWVWALALAASGLILLLTTVNFLVMMRLRRRAWTLARVDLRHWRELWRMGGLSLRLPAWPEIEAQAPEADWREFARRHLAEGGREHA